MEIITGLAKVQIPSFTLLDQIINIASIVYILFDPVFAVYCTVLLFSDCITEKEFLNAGIPLSTQGPYLAPGLEDLLMDLYVINALDFGD